LDYQLIGKTLENTGKDIQKLNNKLDKVLEKLLEVESLEERKADAIARIEAGDIAEAINILKTVEKDQSKAEDLKQEEAKLRDELEVLRVTAEKAAKGEIKPTTEAETPEQTDAEQTDAAPIDSRDNDAA
jgi:DNA polymerase III delta prime subunit